MTNEESRVKLFSVVAAASSLCVVNAHAQPALHINVRAVSLDRYTITAELLNPTGTIRAVLSDLSFTLRAINISNFSYNTAFDSQFFGDATVNVSSSQIDFSGLNTLPPLNNAGGPDSSNPLFIGEFQATRLLREWEGTCFELHGQITGAYVGAPFDEVLFYQYADGSSGDIPVHIDACDFPAPGSFSLMALGGIAAGRRRR